MATHTFLFVNKDSSSPSLSRNTGREAALASKINKHVQQQRFRNGSGTRKVWYRAVPSKTQSRSTTPSSTATSNCGDDVEYGSSPPQTLPVAHQQSPRSHPSSQWASPSRTVTSHPQTPTAREEQPDPPKRTLNLKPESIRTISSKPGSSLDPFNNTVEPLTNAIRDLLIRHMEWAVTSSVSEYTVHKGIKMIISQILTNHMHCTAFLAMATAQQRRTTSISIPQSHSPEFYSYKATRLVRRHILAGKEPKDNLFYVDIFRLAMTEWLNGNHGAARVHFSYIAQMWHTFHALEGPDQHIREVMSSEDIFLAIDLDEQPLLELLWEPALRTMPLVSDHEQSGLNCFCLHLKTRCGDTEAQSGSGSGMKEMRLVADSLQGVLHSCLVDMRSLPQHEIADIAPATSGPIWVIKRRVHATLHRLQTQLKYATSNMEIVISRAVIIILLLVSTTPARRIARTNIHRLALKLKETILETRSQYAGQKPKRPFHCEAENSALWLWVSMVGMVAAREPDMQLYGSQQEQSSDMLVQWFAKESVAFAQMACDGPISESKLRAVLERYLYFESVQNGAVKEVVATLSLRDIGEALI